MKLINIQKYNTQYTQSFNCAQPGGPGITESYSIQDELGNQY